MTKNILSGIVFLTTLITFSGCVNNDMGELTGVQGRSPWFHPQPFGTVYVPGGTFHAGQSDNDVFFTHIAPNFQATVTPFYMDDTEITNNEYRQFVEYVVDSIARYILGEDGEYILDADEDGRYQINREVNIDWEDPETQEMLEEMMVPPNERFRGDRGLDYRKVIYNYIWQDLKAAAQVPTEYARKNNIDRSQYFRTENVAIYPDTLVWVRDFVYSYNEPMTRTYFWHPKYDDYPVVGVTWDQAKAFCFWRTGYLNDYYSSVGEPIVNEYTLPSEYEWEWASRGGRDGSMYPWGGPYTRNSKGCFLANFKPGRGDYRADGGYYPVRVYSYFPNDYGLYNMSGNVAEWTRTAYEDENHIIVHDFNSDYQYDAKDSDPIHMHKKVTRGGSWKDIAYYIQTGTRSYEFEDSAKSYVGFRCKMAYIGRSRDDSN